MKRTELLVTAFMTALFLTACNKDDDNDNSENGTVFPKVSEFSGSEEVDFRLFIGGEELNTADLDPADFLLSSSLENYNNLGNFDINLTFTPDSLNIEASDEDASTTFGYFFEDGKLIITGENSDGDPEFLTFGYGNINAFEVRSGLFTFCKQTDEWPFKDCEDQTSNFFYYTIDSVSAELGLDNVLTEMEQDDTLAIYNYRYVFN